MSPSSEQVGLNALVSEICDLAQQIFQGRLSGQLRHKRLACFHQRLISAPTIGAPVRAAMLELGKRLAAFHCHAPDVEAVVAWGPLTCDARLSTPVVKQAMAVLAYLCAKAPSHCAFQALHTLQRITAYHQQRVLLQAYALKLGIQGLQDCWQSKTVGSAPEGVARQMRLAQEWVRLLCNIRQQGSATIRWFLVRKLQALCARVPLDPLMLELHEGGSAPGLLAYLMQALVPEKVLLAPARHFPSLNIGIAVISNTRPLDWPFARKNFTTDEHWQLLGRTLWRAHDDGVYALKICKQDETPQQLAHEGRVLAWLHSQPWGRACQSIIPRPCYVKGGLLARLARDWWPVAIQRHLQPFTGSGRYYTALCYWVPQPSYFTYLHDPGLTPGDTLAAARRALHDLVLLARHGIVHTALIDLFHNRREQRPYYWMIDLIAPMERNGLPAAGAGRIDQVALAVQYPNLRLSGLADFAELRRWEEIELAELRGQPLPVILASYLGEYLLAVVLTYVEQLRRQGRLQPQAYQEPHLLNELATNIREFFVYTSQVLRQEQEQHGERVVGPAALVDWSRLARQILFFMGGAYQQYLRDKSKGQWVDELYGEMPLYLAKRPEYVWGLLDTRMLRERGVPAATITALITAGVLSKPCFKAGIPLAEWIYQVNQAITGRTIIANQPHWQRQCDATTLAVVEQLLQSYRYGWRYDGRHEDLGPYNGPNPLTELIKALYVFSFFMVTGLADAGGKASGSIP